jgi:hypothetical protein
LHGALAPDSSNQGGNRLSLQFAGLARFRSIALELVVHQNQLLGDLPDLLALEVIGVLGGGDQQAQHQGRDGGDQPGTQPHDVLRMVVQMMLGQVPAQQDSRAGAAQHQQGGADRYGYGAHGCQ